MPEELTHEGSITPQPKTIAEVPAIGENRNQIIKTRDQIPTLVEIPLLSACEEFYDKNIRTLSTSANLQQVNHPDFPANIIIDFDSLSPENQLIAVELGRVVDDYDRRNALILEHDLKPNTSVDEIKVWSNAQAEKFKKQPMTWAPQYTKEQLIEWMMATPDQTPEEIAEAYNYYYDRDANTFFESEEHARKTKENLEMPNS